MEANTKGRTTARGLVPLYVVGGVVVTAALAGFLMWLAFYSANHGYDDRIDQDDL